MYIYIDTCPKIIHNFNPNHPLPLTLVNPSTFAVHPYSFSKVMTQVK